MQSPGNDESDAGQWARIEPFLEAALAQLGEKDHNAVVLRFFEKRSFREVSEALGTSEAGAKMRVTRALEKLRTFFAKRGLGVSTAALAGILSVHSVKAAPFGLATTVATFAVQQKAATASSLTLLENTLKLMAWTKLKTAVVVTAVTLLIASTATLGIQHAKANAGISNPVFAGYATPEASVQSTVWGAGTGEVEKFQAGFTREEMERFRAQMAGKPEAEVRRGVMAWANAMKGYKITGRDVISENEIHLHIHAPPSVDALRTGKAVIVMRKVGNEWKKAGDVN